MSEFPQTPEIPRVSKKAVKEASKSILNRFWSGSTRSLRDLKQSFNSRTLFLKTILPAPRCL